MGAFIVFMFSLGLHFLVDLSCKNFAPSAKNVPNRRSQFSSFQWRNTVISLVHSLIAGIWSLSTVFFYPEILSNLIHAAPDYAVKLVAFSTAYFIFDSIHMVKWSQSRTTWEFLVHHVIVITCFSSTFLSHKCTGYAVIALLAEVNSVFLHLRRVAKQLDDSSRTMLKLVISLINLVTFIVFRFVVLYWMARWLILNWTEVSFGYCCLGSFGLTVIIIMNVVLFMRLIYADFLVSDTRLLGTSLSTHCRE